MSFFFCGGECRIGSVILIYKYILYKDVVFVVLVLLNCYWNY